MYSDYNVCHTLVWSEPTAIVQCLEIGILKQEKTNMPLVAFKNLSGLRLLSKEKKKKKWIVNI